MIGGWLVFMALVVVFVLVSVVAGVVGHRRRVQRMVAFAQHHGWRYESTDHSLTRRFPGSPFGAGSSRRTSHVLSGYHRGAPIVVFEYRYTERSGENSTVYRFTVAVVWLPAVRPRLELTRETGLSRFMGRLGFRDLQLESEEFNETFRIATDDDRFAYDVLNPPTMAWLLADPRSRTPFRFGGDHLIAWCRGRIEPATAVFLLDYVSDIRDRVPTFVWRG